MYFARENSTLGAGRGDDTYHWFAGVRARDTWICGGKHLSGARRESVCEEAVRLAFPGGFDCSPSGSVSGTDATGPGDRPGASRRAVLAGAAAAVFTTQGNMSALTDPHLKSDYVTFPSDAGGQRSEVRAWLSAPVGKAHAPGVIVIHEVFGLTDHIRSVASRLAQAGFTAIAPDLFTREGTPPGTDGGFEPLMKFVSAIPDSQILGDLQAAGTYLLTQRSAGARYGCIGFCWGGRFSMLLDATDTRLAAAVAYYGRITGPHSANQPAHPLEVAAKMHAPLLGHFGGLDKSIPEADTGALAAALKRAGTPHSINVYPDAGHAFNNDTRPSYNPRAAALAWRRSTAWLRRYLGTDTNRGDSGD